jgi:hypothetical protein
MRLQLGTGKISNWGKMLSDELDDITQKGRYDGEHEWPQRRF